MTAQLGFFDGLSERNRILTAMADKHAIYLNALRSFAREIALRVGSVTIDDVREEMERREFPMPSAIGADDRILGALFTRAEFQALRQIPTRRSEWAKRVGRARSFVTVYRLRGAA